MPAMNSEASMNVHVEKRNKNLPLPKKVQPIGNRI